LIAAALIAKDPAKYGFDDTEAAPVRSLTKITVPGGIPLRGIARALSLEVAELKALNPEILKGITPPNRKEYEIKLPGTPDPDVADKKLEAFLANDRRVVDVVRHCVKKRDSLTGILKRYDISRSDLTLVNEDGARIQRGHVLYIPRFASLRRAVTTASDRSGTGIAENRGSEKERRSLSNTSDDDDGVVVLKSHNKEHTLQTARISLATQSVKKAVKRHTARPQKRIASRTYRKAVR
jgi:hypothetical protein